MKTRITLSSALLALGWISGTAAVHSQGIAPTVFQQPDSSQQNPFYPGNRPPLQPSPFIKLPIGAITPQGWLKRQLELDASGMCGNLTELSNFIKDGCAWASPTGEGHHGWEEPMYWLRGYGDLGYVLKDEAISTVSRKWIEAMLASQRPDGNFGPKELMTREKGKPECWPQFLAVNVLRSYHEVTGDSRVVAFLRKYFKWVNTLQDGDFRNSDLDNMRAVEQIANLYWLYNRTGEVGQFPGGGFAGDENISGAIDPRQGFETCGFAEFMRSFQILTRIEGNPMWADRCEEIAFNSYPAALTPDHKGLHYVTCANMVSNDFRNRRVTFCNKWIETLQMSPARSKEPVETVSLIPMAAARLRISSFPTVSDKSSAHLWKTAKLPLTAGFKLSASHTRDSPDAPNDGIAPERSNDGRAPLDMVGPQGHGRVAAI